MCVTHLLGVYCDGVYLYLHVMAHFVHNMGSLGIVSMFVVHFFNVCNIIMSCIFNILRFLSKGSVCALYVLIDIGPNPNCFFCSLTILSH